MSVRTTETVTAKARRLVASGAVTVTHRVGQEITASVLRGQRQVRGHPSPRRMVMQLPELHQVLPPRRGLARLWRRAMTGEPRPVTQPQVRRRAVPEDVTVVATGERVLVEGVDRDALEVLALAYGLEHRWTGSAWSFAAEDVLRVAAALRAGGRSVRLSSGGAPW